MYKVKIITAKQYSLLERDINEFLSQNSNDIDELVDIKLTNLIDISQTTMAAIIYKTGVCSQSVN